MMTKEERKRLIQKANTDAQTRLRREFHREFRVFYEEELKKLGVEIRVGGKSSRMIELQEEVDRLKALLAEKGIHNA
jgi:hypothetical protein